jgi:acetyl esterase/lipase
MPELGAIMLLFGGMAGAFAAWNAAKPVVDPTRRYSPAWLPAMVVGELAPFWIAVQAVVLVLGLSLGGWSNWGGRVGVVLLGLAIVLLSWVIVRTRLGVRRLRPHVVGPVHPAHWPASVFGRPVPTPSGVQERHGIPWSSDLTLDLVRPDDGRRDLPVVVYVHGGGWTNGDPQRQARDLYHALALAGWATAAIRYPFAPSVGVEDQIEVVRAAVRWVRAGLDDHGVSPTSVVLAGGSAGALLAATAALTAGDDRVDGLIGLYGVYDMANRRPTRAHWTKIRDEVMLATIDEAPERYRAVSPVDQAGAVDVGDVPPVLLVHGTHDTLVPIGEAEFFAEVLDGAGHSVELVPVHGAQHAWDALSGITSRTTAALIRDWLHAHVTTPDIT